MEKELKIVPPEGYEVDKEHSTFECIKFKPIRLPKTWKEFCTTHKIQPGESIISENVDGFHTYSTEYCRYTLSHKNILPSQKLAKAMVALCQLIQLRDCYNDGWEPDWKNNKEIKYSIYSKYGDIVIGIQDIVSRVLVFKTEELRTMFLTNFLDLIRIAKPLL